MNQSEQYFLVMPAAGTGSRFDSNTPKQFIRVDDRSVLDLALAPFLAHEKINHCMVVLPKNIDDWHDIPLKHHPKIATTHGADTRAQSVLNGLLALKAVAKKDDWVLVHDAARACITPSQINRLIAHCHDHPVGGLLARKISDTVKQSNADNTVQKTLNRDQLWQAQTPQMFRFELLLTALQQYNDVTDESQAIEKMGLQPLLVANDEMNEKLTRPQDFVWLQRQISEVVR
ncbi:MAG: 2-C-methyl-D-erythritol 4-phosphate cytidylyltransferase [Coxiellaceae bacterium]|nr:2-C-methyl-D-erythritol 4-phosphate cytidylyltransferase [Coxiellaceae bacterium]